MAGINPQLQSLYDIALKTEKWILGTMSGTSLDGLDIALCKISGHGTNTQLTLEGFVTQAYDDDYSAVVRPLFANPQGPLQSLCIANTWIAHKHASLINQALESWNIKASDIDLIASHGQTLYHAPKHSHDLTDMPNATFQAGDGDHIAQLTGIITLSDFRQKHVAAGGEGAPMVKYGDYLLYVDPLEYRVLLNLGGIANASIIAPNASFSEILSTDIGPANTFMDGVVQQYLAPQRYDENGELATAGRINKLLLNKLLAHPFFTLPVPKTTGQEVFSMTWLDSQLEQLDLSDISLIDLLATLSAFSAKAIIDTLQKNILPTQRFALYISGGGAKNTHLLTQIQAGLPNASVHNMDDLGIHGDAKEAALFALLANECVSGNAANTFANTAGSPAVSMGKISLPG
jgi:anhydro-N-acetylmuramic acid kinase